MIKKINWKLAILIGLGTFILGAIQYKVEKDVYVSYFIEDKSTLNQKSVSGISVGQSLESLSMEMDELKKNEDGKYIYKAKVTNVRHPFLRTEKIVGQPKTIVMMLYKENSENKSLDLFTATLQLNKDGFNYSFSDKDLTVPKGGNYKLPPSENN